MRALVAACCTVLALAACGPESGPGTQPAPSTTTTTTAGSSYSKTEPPLTVRLDFNRGDLVVGQPFPVTLSAVADKELGPARATVSASGSVEVVDAPTARWPAMGRGETLMTNATLRIARLGESEIRGSVDVVGDGGTGGFGRSVAVSVLATETEVLTGTTGTLALRLEHLDHERSAGRLAEDDYRRRREEVLGGGARQTGG